MAITSEIIGKLGGAEVESFPVQTGSTTSATTLATVNIPPGEQWLVAVIGSSSTMSNLPNQYPQIKVGDAGSLPGTRYGAYGVAIVATQDVEVRLLPNGGSSSNFAGTVYTVKM